MQTKQSKFKTFLKGFVLAIIAIALIETGRFVNKKRILTPEVNVSSTEISPTDSSVVVADSSTGNKNPASVKITQAAEEFFFSYSFKDLQEELEHVKQEGKSALFIFFEMQDCPYCEYMKDHVLNQIEVQEFYTKNFRNISLDIHAQTDASDVAGVAMTEQNLAAQYGVNLTPTMLFIDSSGRELYRKQGIIKSVEDFMAMGQEIVEFVKE